MGETPGCRAVLPDAAGRDLLQIDSVQLERAIGKEAAARLLQQGGVAADGLTGVAKDIHDSMVRRRADGVPAGPGGVEPPPGFLPIMEMRITSSVDGGATSAMPRFLTRTRRITVRTTPRCRKSD